MTGIVFNVEYPPDATPVATSSGNVANAIATATITALPGRTVFITGFHITSSGATAASVVLAVLTLLGYGVFNYVYTVVAGATLGNPNLMVQFTKPVPAALGNGVVLSLPALGAGNTNAVVTLFGFYL